MFAMHLSVEGLPGMLLIFALGELDEQRLYQLTEDSESLFERFKL